MIEKIKLDESSIGNIKVITYDSYNPSNCNNGLFETVLFSLSFGKRVFYSKEEDEAVRTHERICFLAKNNLIQ